MRRPSFQFYPADWTGNSNLRRCSHAEKGVWLEVMCLMHDQEEYGVLRWSIKEVAQASGCSVSILKGLITKGVLKGDDKQLDEPFVYTPRSGRKDGDPVTLVSAQSGPIWYSSRMVKDEYVRTIRGESSRFGEGNDAASKKTPKATPNDAPKPPLGDGSTSSSSSSPSGTTSDTDVSGAGAPAEPAEIIFGRGVPLLTASGVSEKNARSMLGMLRKTHGDEDVIAALQACVDSQVMEPVAYLQGVLRSAKGATRPRPNRADERANWMASFWQPAQPTMKDMGTIDATC